MFLRMKPPHAGAATSAARYYDADGYAVIDHRDLEACQGIGWSHHPHPDYVDGIAPRASSTPEPAAALVPPSAGSEPALEVPEAVPGPVEPTSDPAAPRKGRGRAE